MNRLESHLKDLQTKNEKAAIFFVTAGDPDLQSTLQIMNNMAINGADSIELGIPFSDPIADGPTIQLSTQRALKNHVNIDQILALIKSFREAHSTPIILMGYYNPIIQYGIESFIQTYKESGGDGLIIADLPYEEGEELESICVKYEICLIYLLAPELSTSRTKRILDASKGFVYCISQYGTTGQQDGPELNVDSAIHSIKSQTSLPVMIGFGISSLENVEKACKSADGIIIGSWLIRELAQANDKPKKAGEFVAKIKKSFVAKS